MELNVAHSQERAGEGQQPVAWLDHARFKEQGGLAFPPGL